MWRRKGDDDDLVSNIKPIELKIPKGTNGGVILSSLSFSLQSKVVSAAESPIAKWTDKIQAVASLVGIIVLFRAFLYEILDLSARKEEATERMVER
jgi:hypothetical protein